MASSALQANLTSGMEAYGGTDIRGSVGDALNSNFESAETASSVPRLDVSDRLSYPEDGIEPQHDASNVDDDVDDASCKGVSGVEDAAGSDRLAQGRADSADEAIPAVGPGAPFWPDRDLYDDPLVQVMMRQKYRCTVSTQTAGRELIRVEELESQLSEMGSELQQAMQALTDTRVRLEVEHQKNLETEIELARKTAVDRKRFLQDKFEDKVEQLRLVERSKVSNLEIQLRREAECAMEEAKTKHKAEIQSLEAQLREERQGRLRATSELERLRKHKSSSMSSEVGATGASSSGTREGDAQKVEEMKPKLGIDVGDIARIEHDQKVRIATAEQRVKELVAELETSETSLRHVRAEAGVKTKRIKDLEDRVSSEMTRMLTEREDYEASQRALREDLSSKLARSDVELRSARRHLEQVRDDYRRERQVNEVISARQLEVLGHLKKHNIELSERIKKLERQLSAANQLVESKGLTPTAMASLSAATEPAIKYNKMHAEEEEWSKLSQTVSRRYDEAENVDQHPELAFDAPAEKDSRGSGGGESLSLPNVRRRADLRPSGSGRGAGAGGISALQAAKRDLVPGSANILKVKDACQSMQAITSIIGDYQQYLVDLTSSVVVASTGADTASDGVKRVSMSMRHTAPLPEEETDACDAGTSSPTLVNALSSSSSFSRGGGGCGTLKLPHRRPKQTSARNRFSSRQPLGR